jgi:hypothetical protein
VDKRPLASTVDCAEEVTDSGTDQDQYRDSRLCKSNVLFHPKPMKKQDFPSKFVAPGKI